ncbi:YLR287C-like protein [Saccharomyces cerevisiae x Saccharomyces kudriavzevii VIN7]|uniref:YLR287C-like protein n=1 Tax=Saccharomyces cerevisiae x Saccharomyces kudriavzevii (strain VIN7) TaxID=1095631 RepID=H0GYI1_SACCK|nr:YLR287C-like protein [Saccharomyces cerevisiae x Saccharomyces kudriavzevii VIN7]
MSTDNNDIADNEKLLELLDSIEKQFLVPYEKQADLRKICSTTKLQDSTPIKELEKLASVLKAHCTKIGIVCKPGTFDRNHKAVFTEIQNFSKPLFYLLSLFPLFYNDKNCPKYFTDQLDESTLQLLDGLRDFVAELQKRLKNEQDASLDKERLTSVGKIFNACDSLSNCSKVGPFGILANILKGNLAIMDDTLDEIKEWLEEPDFSANSTDIFLDFENSESETEVNDEEDFDQEKIYESIKSFFCGFARKIKLIKLLVSTFRKTLVSKDFKPKKNQASTLDSLHTSFKEVQLLLDEVVSTVQFEPRKFSAEEVKEEQAGLSAVTKKALTQINKLYEGDAKRKKWIEIWETKFKELP